MLKDTIVKLLESTQKEGIENLIAHMEKIGYFTAPSSGAYHCSCKGGLMEHSYNVWNFGMVNIRLDNLDIDLKSWKIVSLLHDLGKADYRQKPNYIPNVLKGGKVSESKPFKTNPDRLYIPHEAVSVFIASQFIELTDEEEFAILYHNGMYTSLGRDISGKERPLQQALHFSDMWCSRFIEGKTKNEGDDE
jgi:23S rRNA maturation-related 3'-5' exoribonuclease YhaM